MLSDNPLLMNAHRILQDEIATAKGSVENCARSPDQVLRLVQVLENLSLYFSKMWVIHVVHLLDREQTFVLQHARDNELFGQVLGEIRRMAEAYGKHLLKSYSLYLQKACTKAELALDTPFIPLRYYFQKGDLRLDINSDGLAVISSGGLEVARLPADIEPVVSKIRDLSSDQRPERPR